MPSLISCARQSAGSVKPRENCDGIAQGIGAGRECGCTLRCIIAPKS